MRYMEILEQKDLALRHVSQVAIKILFPFACLPPSLHCQIVMDVLSYFFFFYFIIRDVYS